MVTKELESQMNLEKQAANERLPKCDVASIHDTMLRVQPFGVGAEAMEAVEALLVYKGNQSLCDPFIWMNVIDFRFAVDLNNRASTWNKLETETHLPMLTSLLFDWLEHLKSPILDRDGITYVVIHCDNIEAALNKLPNHVSYILEYLVR